MKKNVTIKDVAKKAGVSISTVSRVINDSKPVTNEVRQKVMEVIKETGYVPNPLARSLVTRRSMLIGVVVPELSDPIVSECLNGIEEVAKMYDYDILLASTYLNGNQKEKSINLLKAKQVEGIILLGDEPNEESLKLIETSGLPAVCISKGAGDLNINTVSTDTRLASKDMTTYLLNKGHKRIALITTSVSDSNVENLKIAGYKDALEAAKIPYDESLVIKTDYSFSSGYETATALLDKTVPDAIFVTSDEAAIGAIHACFDKGYSVPEDISVVGYDNIKFSQMFRPKVTTVFQPLYDMGAVAVSMVIKMIREDDDVESQVRLPHYIVERESVKEK